MDEAGAQHQTRSFAVGEHGAGRTHRTVEILDAETLERLRGGDPEQPLAGT